MDRWLDERFKPLSETALDRRSLLKVMGLGGAGFVIGIAIPNGLVHANPDPDNHVFNAFVRVATDNTVTVVIKHLDKGQGVTTGLTTIVAEEMDADWAQMRWQFAPADASLYANLAWGRSQGTGGSSSIRNSWMQLREAGAVARGMLVSAAAERWAVKADALHVEQGMVRLDSARTATFGELAEAASEVSIDAIPPLKSAADFKFIGKHVPRIDSTEKSSGRAKYTIDISLPDMLHAAVQRAPRFGASLSQFDDSAAKAIKGVVDVVEVPSGVAVIANDYWTALKGRSALQVSWQADSGELRSSADISAALRKAIGQPGAVAARRGDVDTAFEQAAQVVEGEFEFPYLAHGSMEPLNAIVQISGGRCEIWTGCQSQTRDQSRAAEILGFDKSRVTINTLLAGGSFGRRAVPVSDFVAEAVHVAKAIGTERPVKVQWTREDDMQGGYYRPVSLHRLKAGLDKNGQLIAWSHRVAGQSFLKGTSLAGMIRNGVDVTLVEGARGLPYHTDNFLCDTHIVDTGVPTLWWRSVGHTHNGYATEVFFDQVAAAAGRDPIEMRQALLKRHPRHLGVLNLALKNAGPPPTGKNRGRGIAVHESFRSFVAEIADVTVHEDGTFTVDEVTAAVDCGIAINPDIIRAQVEGAIGYGMSAALREAVTLTNGEVNQKNFDRYQPLRINEMPKISVHIVPSVEAPTGIGEPGTPPIGPAIANALSKVTGRVIRKLPIGKTA